MTEQPEVSIVICTRDRPDRLKRLLDSIRQQQTTLIFEVIVVDNHPASLALEPLKGGLDWVHWTVEPRAGLSRARNTGIRTARAPILVLLDDDVEVPQGWLQALVDPLSEGYDAVTGPTMPLKLDTAAELLFEAYGGHGHGRQRKEYNRDWLQRKFVCLPLWRVGGFCNAAIRRKVFDGKQGNGFEELLGAGTPAGSWEDLYLFYRMLNSGYRILHEPAAAVWHAHREDLAGLEAQLCNYRRGEVCFSLLVTARYRDPRALIHLLLWVPYWRIRLFLAEVGRRVRGRRLMPFPLMLRELMAYLSGPAALLGSLRLSRRTRMPSAPDPGPGVARPLP
jgi:glycosyltransferase involved in cell wall biosynthesis